ncbi:putative virion core protein [Lumpy skin disease virus]|uniref:Virion core protein 4b n=1 Tax=Lumpy skin disease virus TaxID=59509 RepID=A0A1C9HHV3_LSDV|nr:putative virion core protein [Lumpy skin disease virus]AOO78654.1 putative virion core protein [Lumpy skin disease virus]AOO78813.1 putative virion core protein [Lumpy skin disease virus]AOO78971.1 putative virion core protein [Lumpy skin disease virus]AVR51531.1 putative virion core protein [Lumpy skin disease virus]
MESSKDIFLTSKVNLHTEYKNQTLSLVDNHVHTPITSLSCSICNSLSNFATSDDIISAGARQRSLPMKRRILSKDKTNETSSPCPNNKKEDTNTATVPIDEVASTNDWQVKLRKDGNMIARYLTDNKCNVSNFTIQDMLTIMRKLNIMRSNRNELFELLAHVKSSLTNSSMSVKSTHPLVLIHSHAHPKIGEQLKELEKLYSPTKQEILLSTTRFQSIHFVDMSSSSDLAFHYRDNESTYYIHPIFMSLFGVKLPALENTFVYGDSYSLLQQLYDYKKVNPDNYMLLVNRLTEEAPIVFTGISDVISTEIQRANIHTMIKKLIMRMRMGIFYCSDEESIDPFLMKIIHTNCSEVMSDEEQIIASILSIVGFKPTLVSIPKPGFMNNYEMQLQSVPYIVINPMKMITTSNCPISINTGNINSLTFDGNTGRVVFAPPNIGYGYSNPLENHFNAFGNNFPTISNISSPVIVNGVLIFYVERRQHRNTFGGECYTGYRSIINDSPIELSQEVVINGIMYKLKSAVCYKVGDNFFECHTNNTDIFLKGHYSIIFTELGPWMYDPLSFFNKSSRDSRMMRSLKNQYRKTSNNNQLDESDFYEWLKGEGASFLLSKQQMLMNHITMFDDDLLKMEEAMSLISRQCCMLIYSQDYDSYITAKNITELF